MNLKSIKQLYNLIPCYQILYHNNSEISIVIPKESLSLVLRFLKLHINCQYKLLSCISGVDFLGANYRFCIAYELLSLVNSSRIRVKIYLNEVSFVESATNIFHCANWWEREIWDMYGVYFQSHPDLRRILTDYGFEGYPLRKDFPLSGYVEIRYDDIKKRVVMEAVQITQEYRGFNHEIQW